MASNDTTILPQITSENFLDICNRLKAYAVASNTTINERLFNKCLCPIDGCNDDKFQNNIAIGNVAKALGIHECIVIGNNITSNTSYSFVVGINGGQIEYTAYNKTLTFKSSDDKLILPNITNLIKDLQKDMSEFYIVNEIFKTDIVNRFSSENKQIKAPEDILSDNVSIDSTTKFIVNNIDVLDEMKKMQKIIKDQNKLIMHLRLSFKPGDLYMTAMQEYEELQVGCT